MAHRGVATYRALWRRRLLFTLAMAAGVAVLAVYSLSVSDFNITFAEAFSCLADHVAGVPPDGYIKWIMTDIVINDNAPRAICGIAAGGSLAVSGAVMQSVTRNPLADPYTIGISSAAMFGVTIAVILGIAVLPSGLEEAGVIANAFAFSLAPAAAILFVATFRKVTPTMMVLIGIAMMYMFSAFTTFLKFNATDDALAEIFEWGLGTMAGTDWSSVPPMAVSFAAMALFSMALANKMNVLSAGENASSSLGVNPARLRVACFVAVSLATAVTVCFTGTIGFVGLVAPHIARLFVGSDNKILIPVSALVGAFTILGADCIVRLLPGGLPVGVVTALVGSPLFLYFLYRQRKSMAW
ncbi:MAG: iron ABC transporter permease [Candidatus Methanoplasma sp.]|jgi:iron complex transport system permease protein/cobaltochelatase CobN|nr:iron ABC transporter permease [Candidatus Methanoplasma sp.]